MTATLHELAEAVEAGIAHVVVTGEPVTAAVAMVAATFTLNPRELEVFTRAIQICLSADHAEIPPNAQPRLH